MDTQDEYGHGLIPDLEHAVRELLAEGVSNTVIMGIVSRVLYNPTPAEGSHPL